MKRRKHSGPNGEPLLGHPTALRWQCAPGAFNYIDAHNQNLDGTLWILSDQRLELSECDAFIEALEAEGAGAGQELRGRREAMLAGYLQNDLREVARHADWIMLRMREVRSAERAQPAVDEKAKRDATFKAGNDRRAAEAEVRRAPMRDAARALQGQHPTWNLTRIINRLAADHGWPVSALNDALRPKKQK